MVDAWTQTSDKGSDNELSMVQKDLRRQEMLKAFEKGGIKQGIVKDIQHPHTNVSSPNP